MALPSFSQTDGRSSFKLIGLYSRSTSSMSLKLPGKNDELSCKGPVEAQLIQTALRYASYAWKAQQEQQMKITLVSTLKSAIKGRRRPDIKQQS